MLTIDEIRAAHGPQFWMLDVPEWGGQVRADRLTAQALIALSEGRPDNLSGPDAFAYLVKLIRLSLKDGDGNPLIGDADAYLLEQNPTLVTRLGTELLALNKMDRKKN